MSRVLFNLFVALLIVGFFKVELAHSRGGMMKMPNAIVPQSGENLNQKIELLYFGGPIIPQVKIVSVHWSSQVHPIIRKEMAEFYSTFVASSQMDWLTEYNTQIKAIDGRDGTQQTFVKGSFLLDVTINPKNTSNRLTDDEVKAEIAYQIAQNNLPRPDSNTLYSIHFPQQVTISIEGMSSCRSFGGYHYYSEDSQFGTFYYSVLPDCVSGAESDDSRLRRMTFVASHEIMEAITDPIPTAGSQPAFPQAWNTKDGNEISDICVYKGTQIQGASRVYSVTTNWSNKRQICYDGK